MLNQVRFIIWIAIAIVSSLPAHAQKRGDTEVDTLVLCPIAFQPALQPWLDYRKAQGHLIKVVSPSASALGIKRQIFDQAGLPGNTTLKHVFIVGDSGDIRQDRSNLTRTDYIPAKVNVLFGSSPEIASDNTYADLDLDGVPDLAIGRLPADSSQEVEQFVQRVIRYETEMDSGAWLRRINCIAGVGGFGPMIDGVIEKTTKQILTELIPGGYETSMTYGSWTSPYCPDPRKFSEEAIERFNEGCLFWVYIGHGHRDRLDKLRLPDKSDHRILDMNTVSKLSCREGSPIAIFLACFTGACDYRNDCLVERMVRGEKGPVAAICGTRVTMPYAMSLLSLEMVHEYFEGNSATLGEMLRLAKCRMVKGSDNYPFYRQMIEGMGQAFSPKKNLLLEERLEHVHLIHLIGDPLLRLKRPDRIKLTHADQGVSGMPVAVKIDVPFEGDLVVELAYQRDRLKKRMKRRNKYDPSDKALAEYQKTYESSRDLVTVKKVLKAAAGPFKLTIDAPDDTSGPCVIRAMLTDSNQRFAIGSGAISLKKNRAAAGASTLNR